jgi:hypothetical protein
MQVIVIDDAAFILLPRCLGDRGAVAQPLRLGRSPSRHSQDARRDAPENRHSIRMMLSVGVLMDTAQDSVAIIEFGRFTVVPSRREVLVEGQPIKLGAAFDILTVLVEAQGKW